MALTQVDYKMLDETGSLGIGTSSPTYKLDVQAASGDVDFRIYTAGTASGDHTFIRSSIAGTTGSNYLYFGDGSDADVGLIQYNHASNYMRFYTNAAERLRIDSAGRVTTPNQPSFHAYSNANLNHGTTDTKYVWNLTRHNIGSHYDTSNGRFTAPIDGRYYFNVSALQNVGPTSYYTRVWLYKNGSVFLDGLNAQALQSGYGRLDIDAVVEASAGDYFETYFVSNNSSAFVYATYSWFSGHLLG